MSPIQRTAAFRLLLGVMFSLFALSCKDYEYVSPTPGILDVRLKVVNSRQSLIPFSPTNEWYIMLKELNGLQPDGVKLRIYGDVNAIRRTDPYDLLNTLDTLARDSSTVMGQVYASPSRTFVGLDMIVYFSPILSIFRNRLPLPINIGVEPPRAPAPPPQTYFRIPDALNMNIKINEGRVTRVTVTLNLDSVLVRRAESFELHPSFYISSVQNF